MSCDNEISYDEIFYPGDLDSNNNDGDNKEDGESTRESRESSEEGESEKDGESPREADQREKSMDVEESPDRRDPTSPFPKENSDLLDTISSVSEPEKLNEVPVPRVTTVFGRIEVVPSQDKTRKRRREPYENQKERESRKRERKERKKRAARRSPSYDEGERRSRSKDTWKRGRSTRRERSSSSESRGTYEDFQFELNEDECPHSCKPCHRGFYTIRELIEHEIRMHDPKIPCYHCDKEAISVTKLAAHMLFRHADMEVPCKFCGEKFGNCADKMDKEAWEDFRSHVYREVLKKKMYDYTTKISGASSDAVALRGVGRCPHGAAVKCKNFPQCPGAKCIYSHGQCRYDITCNKPTCPFDHSKKPRLCMACVNDLKQERNRSHRR